MSMGIIKNGKYVQVAGNPSPSGELVMGASTIRKGTVTVPVTTSSDETNTITVTFDSPMPDANYAVALDLSVVAGHSRVLVANKSADGFKLSVTNVSKADIYQGSFLVNYTAFKLYTVEGLEELEAKVNGFGKKVLWTGNVTKGDNVGTLNLAGYDIVIAYINGRPAYIQGAPANGGKHKFIAHWTGRDSADGALYFQEYVCDIAPDGTVWTCAWLKLGNNGIIQEQIDETNINLTQIIGYKFPTLE